MADMKKSTDGPPVTSTRAWDYHTLPDWDDDFYGEDDILAFASALSAPEHSPSEEDLLNRARKPADAEFITALNDWRPIRQRVRGSKAQPTHASSKAKRRKKPRRGKDETREGWTYSIFKYPFLFTVFAWLFFLSFCYLLTRFYIYAYEQYVTWRGKRERLRNSLSKQTSYGDWVKAAEELDRYLGNDQWKEDDEYAYYDSRTIKRVVDQMYTLRRKAEVEDMGQRKGVEGQRAVDQLRALAEACVKNNFAGSENPRCVALPTSPRRLLTTT